MLLAIVIIGLGGLEWNNTDFYDERNLTFWMEATAIELFGISWLIKGETLIKDKQQLKTN